MFQPHFCIQPPTRPRRNLSSSCCSILSFGLGHVVVVVAVVVVVVVVVSVVVIVVVVDIVVIGVVGDVVVIIIVVVDGVSLKLGPRPFEWLLVCLGKQKLFLSLLSLGVK